jgi:hypothetical protein
MGNAKFCSAEKTAGVTWRKGRIIKSLEAGKRQLTHMILATREAEIRKIAVRSQPRKIVLETLSQKYPTQKKDWQSGSSGRTAA